MLRLQFFTLVFAHSCAPVLSDVGGPLHPSSASSMWSLSLGMDNHVTPWSLVLFFPFRTLCSFLSHKNKTEQNEPLPRLTYLSQLPNLLPPVYTP